MSSLCYNLLEAVVHQITRKRTKKAIAAGAGILEVAHRNQAVAGKAYPGASRGDESRLEEDHQTQEAARASLVDRMAWDVPPEQAASYPYHALLEVRVQDQEVGHFSCHHQQSAADPQRSD